MNIITIFYSTTQRMTGGTLWEKTENFSQIRYASPILPPKHILKLEDGIEQKNTHA